MTTPTIIQQIEHLNSPYQWEGYKIITNNESKNIIIKISNYSLCCKTFGVYINCINNDNEICNLDFFVGAEYNFATFEEKNTQIWIMGVVVIMQY